MPSVALLRRSRRLLPPLAAALLAVGAVRWASGGGDGGGGAPGCRGPEPVRLPLWGAPQGPGSGTTMAADACAYFSRNYTEARDRFRAAARVLAPAGATLESLLVHRDSQGTEYHMDICVVPGAAPGLVVHSSGLHGVEGFAGSAVQLALLDSSLRVQGPDRPTLVLVHAVNPYGMAHYRRVNERNVDLNRNALTPPEFERLAAAHARPHEAYRRFRGLLNPPRFRPTVWGAHVVALPRLVGHLCRDGVAAIKAAMVSGQYEDPRGVFYGGTERVEPSTRLLRAWLERYLSRTRGAPKGSSSLWGRLRGGGSGSNETAITWIDLHTGLGPSGRDTLLPGSFESGRRSEDGTDVFQYLEQQLRSWFPDSLSPRSNTVADGYEDVRGLYGTYFADLLRQYSPRSLFLVQEIGTRPAVLVGHALITENAAFHYYHSHADGDAAAAAGRAREWAQRQLLPAFYVPHPTWRRSILEQGVRVALQAMARSVRYSGAQDDVATVDVPAT